MTPKPSMAFPTRFQRSNTRYALSLFKAVTRGRIKYRIKQLGFGLLAIAPILFLAQPALAHHPFGKSLPATAFEGFLSGIGHPVIGFDHFAFVIAAGLIAATKRRGFFIPLAFVAASIFGTLLHLQLVSLPAPEVVVSASVLLFGIVLALGSRLSLQMVSILGALSGIFHGYAYGEAIVGAEPSPVVAYLTGFATVQIAIACLFFAFGRSLVKSSAMQSSEIKPLASAATPLTLRLAGFALAGAGMVFLSSAFLYGRSIV